MFMQCMLFAEPNGVMVLNLIAKFQFLIPPLPVIQPFDGLMLCLIFEVYGSIILLKTL